jgi:hypothetical protein
LTFSTRVNFALRLSIRDARGPSSAAFFATISSNFFFLATFCPTREI